MRVVLTALLALLFANVASAPTDASAATLHDDHVAVERGDAIKIGDTLQATRDVSLDEAVIAEGSKVSVSGKRSSSAGVVLDVALADGHVVKGVPLVEIRKSFRRVSE